MSRLAVHGWLGPGDRRLGVSVDAGQCVEIRVPDPLALLRRVAGLATPLLWVRLDGQEWGRHGAAARAAAGLATVDGRLPRGPELTVLDLLLLGRRLPGRLGFLGAATEARREAAEEREADARALAGRLGLAPLLDEPMSALDPRAAVVVDVTRALMAEPRALVAALPEDAETAGWLRARLAEAAAERDMGVLLLRRDTAG